MNIINILAIAPYPDLAEIITQASKERINEVHIDVFTGDMEEGVSIARMVHPDKYDVILSRGITADLIEKEFTTPIISITPTLWDVLRILQIASTLSCPYAIVAFPSIGEIFEKLFSISDEYKSDLYSVHSVDDIEPVISKLQRQGIKLIIGSNTIVNVAHKYGLSALLITSGIESVHSAINSAIRLYQIISRLTASSVQTSDDNCSHCTLIKSCTKNTIFSDIPPIAVYEEVFNRFADSYIENCNCNHNTLTCRTERWISDTHKVTYNDMTLYIFSFTKQESFLITKSACISVCMLQKNQADTFICARSSPRLNSIIETVKYFGRSAGCVLISVERGVPYTEFANAIMNQNPWNRVKYVNIDCSKLDSRSVRSLLNSTNSPLSKTKAIIMFDHFSSFPSSEFNAYREYANASRLHMRNLVLYCSDALLTEEVSHYLESCRIKAVGIPSVCELLDEMYSIVHSYIILLNKSSTKKLSGITDAALTSLSAYNWPGNYDELFETIADAFHATDAGYIQKSTIDALILSKQHNSIRPVSSQLSSKFDGTLDDMIYNIVKKTLDAEHGNRTKAANKLAIGRTTLWRILQRKEYS